MKKILTTVLIVLIVLVSFCATTFASQNIKTMGEGEQFMSQVTPQFNYIPLVAPKHVAAGEGNIISASDSQLFIYNLNGKYGVYPLNLPKDTMVMSLAVTGQIAIVLYEFKDTTTAYKIFSITDGSEINTEGLNLPIDVMDIDEDGEFIYMWKGDNTLDKISCIDNIISSSSMSIPQEGIFKRSKLFDMFEGNLYVYNSSSAIVKLTGSAVENIFSTNGITTFNMTNRGVYFVNAEGLKFYDITTASEWNNLGGNYQGLAVMDNTAYSCSTNQNRIVMATAIGGELKLKTDYLGDRGDALDRLDTPTDLAIYGDDLYIADGGNKRVSCVNVRSSLRFTYTLNEVTPKLITAYQDKINIIDSNNILRSYSRDQSANLTQEYFRDLSAYGDIIDIENYCGVIVALSKSGDVLLVVNGQDTIKYLTAVGAKAITINEFSQYMYIMSNEVTTRYNLKTNLSDKEYLVNSSTHSDIAIDFVGTAYFLNNQSIDRYARVNHVYAKDQSYDIAMSQTKIKIHLNSGDMYILDKLGHKLMVVSSKSIDSKSIGDMGYTHPAKDEYNIARVFALKEAATLFSAPNNDESISVVNKDEMFYVLSKVIYNNIEYSYGVRYGEHSTKYYIESSMLELLNRIDYPSNHPPMMPIFPSGAKVYKYPYKTAPLIAIAPKSSQIFLANNVASNEGNHLWKWFEVQYKDDNGETIKGYIENNDIYYSSVVAPPKNRDYLKIQTENFGGNVKMHKEPNETSEVLYDSLADGTKVILGSEHFDLSAEYTKVIYDNKVGYIKTSNLIPEGLTQSEITAVVVVSVSVLVIILLIVLLILRKKLFKKKTKEIDIIPR